MFCTECGKKIDDDSVFCTHCGAPVNHDPKDADGAAASQSAAKPSNDPIGGDALPDSAFMPQTPDPHSTPPSATAVMPSSQPASPMTVSAPSATPAETSGKNPYKIIAIVAGIIVVVLLVVCGVIFALNAGAFGGGEPADASSTQQSPTAASSSTSSPTATASTAQEVAIPNVVGLSQSDALEMLSREGFATSAITEEHSVSTPEGFVISQSPAGGQMGDPSTVRVSLVVSSGPQETVTETEYTVVSQAMTWSEANAYCAGQGGALACITSQAEYDKVLAVAEQSGLHVLWLGGQRSGSSFSWVSGEPFSFSSWAPGEPNNDGGSENYLALYNVNGAWGWYDAPNDLGTTYPAHTMGFVMEREVQRTR